ARRDLQRALDMLEAHEAATGGSRDQRAAADRQWPDVVAAEHASYETIAALWAIEQR
ncbi:FUSC family protein, partial [Mycobacterium rufum]|nr:FUSC family protein [Mycolicibacterium rufum]